MRRLLGGLVMLLALGLLAVPSAFAAAPASEIAVDIEDEVMCLSCGRPLSSSGGTGAEDQRELIRRLADEGLSKQQIKDRLVTEYGERILVKNASPVAAIAPWAAVLVGFAVIVGVWRRRSSGPASRDDDSDRGDGGGASGAPASGEQREPLDPETQARIDAELSESEQA